MIRYDKNTSHMHMHLHPNYCPLFCPPQYPSVLRYTMNELEITRSSLTSALNPLFATNSICTTCKSHARYHTKNDAKTFLPKKAY